MSEARFTPGPWRWYNGCSWWRLGLANDQTKHAAIIAPTFDSDKHPNLSVSVHDRNLIAAAPELYEALDNMTSIAAGLAAMLHGKNPEEGSTAAFMDREYPSIRAAMDLLAKARGNA